MSQIFLYLVIYARSFLLKPGLYHVITDTVDIDIIGLPCKGSQFFFHRQLCVDLYVPNICQRADIHRPDIHGSHCSQFFLGYI